MTDAFNSRVQRRIEHLQHCSYQAIEAEVAQKRLAWLRQHGQIAARYDRPTPRQAFDLLFFDYMGLSPHDLPIVSETETEIVWQSANPCPTLEAVKALGLDTRTVCRAAYEKSTQAFVSQLDPQLRFLRSYEEIMTGIPWVSFTSLQHPIRMHPVDSVPRISWGKYFAEGGALKLPLSVQVHHALMDGVHIGRYFTQVQVYFDQPERLLGAG